MEIEYPIGGFAPGNYFRKCTNCKQEFTGDKRAVQCEPCAINAVNKNWRLAMAGLRKLKTALQKIKFSNDTINEVLNQ